MAKKIKPVATIVHEAQVGDKRVQYDNCTSKTKEEAVKNFPPEQYEHVGESTELYLNGQRSTGLKNKVYQLFKKKG